MKIDFESQFHKDLYAKVYRSNQKKMVATWLLFLKKYPEYFKYSELWIKSREPDSSPLSLQLPWIAFTAIDWLASNISEKDNVFEWGMGGSTIFLAKKCKKVIAIEHDNEWFVRAKMNISDSVGSTIWIRIKRKYKRQLPPDLVHIKATECSVEYTPSIVSGVNGFGSHDFSDYVNHIKKYPLNYFDYILVDGRARMDCFEVALPHCRKGGYIVLDNSDYERYKDRLSSLEANALKDWSKVTYLSPGPSSSCIGWRTTAYRKPE